MAVDAILQAVTEIVLNAWTRKHRKAWRRVVWIVLLVVLAVAAMSTAGK
jgi:uncharacterized membrane protein HdeD (DUF308 family)